MDSADNVSDGNLNDRWDEIGIEGGNSAEFATTLTEDLWLDRIARKLGMGWLSDKLPGDIPPAYLYAIIMIGCIESVLSTHAYLEGEPVIYIQNPFFVFQPIALLGAVYGSRSLRQRYHRVTEEMSIQKRAENPERLINLVPSWLPWILFIIAICLNFARMFALGGPIEIYREVNLSSLIGWTIANPVWASIATQFLAVYLSVEIIAPWRLLKS
ncbi:MAG: hypothetical protein ACOCUA_03150, partial [archaeon]